MAAHLETEGQGQVEVMEHSRKTKILNKNSLTQNALQQVMIVLASAATSAIKKLSTSRFLKILPFSKRSKNFIDCKH